MKLSRNRGLLDGEDGKSMRIALMRARPLYCSKKEGSTEAQSDF